MGHVVQNQTLIEFQLEYQLDFLSGLSISYTNLKPYVYAWIHLKIYNKMHNIIPIYII